jgi:hypothetical protein
MTITTLLRFLAGDRDSILRIANIPRAIWIGLLFVFAAGVAREYDREDLLHEPWHLLIPLVASLASSFLLYVLVHFVAWRRSAVQPSLIAGYRIFLTLYWMTAPLALLYAVPFERFLSAADAVRANLWLLALIALWRLLLMTRVIAVIYSAQYTAALAIVLSFADSVLLAALQFFPVPIFAVMGGVRLSEAEQVIQITTLFVSGLGFLSWPFWLICAAVVACHGEPQWRYVPSLSPPNRSISAGMWITAIAAVCALFPLLPFTQREQSLRQQVEIAMLNGQVKHALEVMSAHSWSDFPPHWDPPPKIAYRQSLPNITDLQEQILNMEVAPWVREQYDEKYAYWMHGKLDYFGWHDMSQSELERHISILEQMPNAKEILRNGHYGLTEKMEMADESLRSRIERLLEHAGVPIAPKNSPTPSP